MEVHGTDNALVFRGVLDEKCPIDLIEEALQKAAQKLATNSRVALDFSNVKRANSCGILAWFKLTEQLVLPISYINVPVWLVEQFGFTDFAKSNAVVESVFAPFYCPEKDVHELFLLRIGIDVPFQDNYLNWALERKNAEGWTFEPDFEPDQYFRFLALSSVKGAGSPK